MRNTEHTLSDKYPSMLVRLQREDNFDFLSDEYQILFENSDATAFQQPIWLHEIYQTLVPNRYAKPIILAGRSSEDDKLMFILPMTLRHLNGVSLLESADLGVCDYSSPIVDCAMVEHLAEQKIQQMIDEIIGNYDVVRLKPVREETVDLWSIFFEGEYKQLEFSSHELPIQMPFQDWREATYSSSLRKEIDRKHRKFHRDAELSFVSLSCDQAVDVVGEIQRLRAGRFDGDPIQQDFVLSFYQKVAKTGSTQGITHVHKLIADGKTVGALFGLSRGGTHHGILMGSDYDTFGKYSPAMLMIDNLLENWSGSGGKIADFNIGDEPYKQRFGATPVKLYQLRQAKGAIGWLANKVLDFQNK